MEPTLVEVAWHTKILDHILQGPHFIGLLLYIGGSVLLEVKFFLNREELKQGLKGGNGMWENPEIIMWIYMRLFPQFIMWVTLLEFRPPEELYWIMGVGLLFALTGRWGLEFLLTRGMSITKRETTTVEQTSNPSQSTIKKESEESSETKTGL